MPLIRFTHLTDLHLPIPKTPGVQSLINKRFLGYLSWLRRRRRRHVLAALDIAAADALAQGADMHLITGDIVNIALPEEFAAAQAWLTARFNPEQTAFCPGNHDTYVAAAWEGGMARLAPYMRGRRESERRKSDGGESEPRGFHDFPFVRRAGDVAFIMANSSPPTAPGLASGRLGADQIALIEKELATAGEKGRCRVLAIHHPITHAHVSRRKGLDDAAALQAAIARAGVELVIHGHTHFPTWETIETRLGPRPIAGGGSASHPDGRGRYRPARYTLFTTTRDAAGSWTIDANVRELDVTTGAMQTIESRRLL